MKQVALGKTSLAWFKLAEFVTRGEKERALSIFRLLAHSIRHDALVVQLEGDILHAFDDARALDSYRRAARLFKKEGDLVQALFLYKALCALSNNAPDVLVALIELYELQGDEEKALEVSEKLIAGLVKQNLFADANDAILKITLPSDKKARLHEQVVIGLLSSELGYHERSLIEKHLSAALDGYLFDTNEQRSRASIARFLPLVAALDSVTHEKAASYIKAIGVDDAQMDGMKELGA